MDAAYSAKWMSVDGWNGSGHIFANFPPPDSAPPKLPSLTEHTIQLRLEYVIFGYYLHDMHTPEWRKNPVKSWMFHLVSRVVREGVNTRLLQPAKVDAELVDRLVPIDNGCFMK